MRTKQEEHRKLLNKTVQGMENLNKKLDEIIKNQRDILEHIQRKKEEKPKEMPQYEDKLGLDALTLLSLPNHLRKTATAICKLGRATVEDVAKHTGREVAVENDHLNQLVTMGYLKKNNQADKIHFHL